MKKIGLIGAYDKTDLIDELIDRYGDVPESVIGLIDISLLRNTASILGISEITQRNGQLYFYTENLDMKQAQALSQAYKGKITLNGINKSYVAVKIMPKSSPFELMKDVVRIMRDNR